MVPYPLQSKVAEEFYQSEEKRRMLLAFRGFGKTEKNVGYPCWRMYQNPDLTVMVISAREQRAIDIVSAMLRTIKSTPFLSHLSPDMDDLAGRKRFTVGCRGDKGNTQPSAVAYGIGSQITGNHVDLIIVDDIEIPQNSTTIGAREKIRETIREFEDILNPGGEIVVVGTPQTEDSTYFAIAEGFHVVRIPVEYPDTDDEKSCRYVPDWLLDKMKSSSASPGDSVMPEKFDRKDLLEKRAQQGLSRYSLQMLLDPAAADESRYPLKLRDFIVHNLNPQIGPDRIVWGKTNPARDVPSVGMGSDQFYRPAHIDKPHSAYEQTVMFIDPAGLGADEVGYAVAKTLKGYIHVTAAGGLDGGYGDATLIKLMTIAIEQGVDRIVVESNWGGSKEDSSWIKLFGGMLAKHNVRIAVEPEFSTGQKEIRIIEALEPAMTNHRIVIDEQVARDQVLMTQLTRITRDRKALKHDDRLEALAGVVSQLSDNLIIDPDKLMEEAEERERLDLLREWGPPQLQKPRSSPKLTRWGSRRRGR